MDWGKRFLILIVFVPSIASAAFVAGWNATSTTQGSISPTKINGIDQNLIISSTGTSTFANGINLITQGCFAINNVCVGASITGTGVAGQITFWDSPTSITGSSTLLWFNATGTVSIGSTTPAQNGLAVKTFPQLVIDGRGRHLNGLVIANIAGGTANFGIDLSNSGLFGASDYYVYASTSDSWAANGSLNVSGSFQLDGTTRVNNFSVIGHSGPLANGIGHAFASEPFTGFASRASSTLSLTVQCRVGAGNGACERVYIDQHGRMGVGTSSPFAFLSAHLNATATPLTTAFAIGSSTASATTTLFMIDNTGSTTASNGFNITAGCFAINDVCLGQNFLTSYDAWTHPAVGQSATTSLMIFSNGFISNASSSIGNGTGAGGLTVSGNSTTTGSIFAGTQSATSGFLYNATNDRGSIGGGDIFHTVSGVNRNSKFEVHSEGGTDPMGFVVHRHSNNDAMSGWYSMFRSRGDHATPLILTDTTGVGRISSYGYDGTDYEPASEIRTAVNGTPANNVMPARLIFSTNPGGQSVVEQMTILANGNVGIGTTSPYTKLAVTGTIVANTFIGTSTIATSTLANGLNITGGCYALNATCIGTVPLNGTNGQVLAWLNGVQTWTATTTFSGGLTYLNGNVTNTLTAGDGLTRTVDDIDCDTASASVFGCLSSANWSTFNNKIGTSSSETSGYIPFATTNSATPALLSFDSNFFWDNVNKYLGIGTAIPTASLEISGATKPPLVFNQTATQGSATTTNSYWNDSNTNLTMSYFGGLATNFGGVFFKNSTTTTFQTTASETSIIPQTYTPGIITNGTSTIPANYLYEGQQIVVNTGQLLTVKPSASGGAMTGTYRIKLNGTTLCTATNTYTSDGSNRFFNGTASIVIYRSGSSGLARCTGQVSGTTLTGSTVATASLTGTADSAIDTTVANTVGVTWQFSSSNANNQSTTTLIRMEIK